MMKKSLINTFITGTIVLMVFISTFVTRANACHDCKVTAESLVFKNREDEALPQTIIQKMVNDFMNNPLSNGKETKKVLILGFDGFRRDGLNNIANSKNSAIKFVMKSGGLYHSFAGGISDFPQATSTSPGWASIITGGWYDYHGVIDNGIQKNDVPTLFENVASLGYSTTFISSWKEHFETVYTQDIEKASLLNISSQYILTKDDDDSKKQAIEAIQQGSELIMAIAEYTDHVGHDSGYGNHNPLYQEACQQADAWGKEIINAVINRDDYLKEEWLMIITTDHGGIDLHHGGQSDEEKNTWLATNHTITIEDETLSYSKNNQ